ncbi:PepSY domain-containing protein [Streptomyces sp. NPDC054796]
MKRKIVIATVAAAALVGGGAASTVAFAGDSAPNTLPQSQQQNRSSVQLSDDDADDRDDKADAKDDNDSRDDDGDDSGREAKAAKITAAEAVANALKSVPGTVTGADLDNDGNGLVWEVDVLGKDNKWHDVTLDAGNGKVLDTHVDKDDDGDDDRGQSYVREDLKGAKTDAAAAAEKGASHAGGTVTSVDLDDDSERYGTVWEVETVGKDGKEHNLAVDVTSGKVSQLADDDGDNDSDDRDDKADDRDDHDDKNDKDDSDDD